MKKRLRFLALMIVLISVFFSQVPLITEATSSTKQKIDALEKEKEKNEQEVDEAKNEVSGLNKKQRSLENELDSLNEDLEGIANRLEELENEIKYKEEEIIETEELLESARERETSQYKAMKKRIQFMYEESQSLYLEIIFKAKTFSDFITLNNYIDSLAGYDQSKFEEYKETRIEIEDLEAKLQSEKVDLEVLKAEAETEKASVMEVIGQTSKKVLEYDELIDTAEETLKAREQELADTEADLEKALAQYEEEKRLAQLARQSAWRDISEVTFEEGDRYLLANLIYCEAGGEIYEGKVAVGAVVINRVLSSKYPDTVTGVIYQKSQFSPAGSGRLAYALSVDKATDDCYRAADEAMSGVTNVGNCLYFRTPIPGLTGQQIGNHIFY